MMNMNCVNKVGFDINDFDETLPGPFDWDVKRLAASVAVAALDSGASKKKARSAAHAAATAYRNTMSMSCSTKRTVTSVLFKASLIVSIMGYFSATYTPLVGSSSKSNFGSPVKAIAISSNLRTPPGSSATFLRA